jgi:hypothetical protein
MSKLYLYLQAAARCDEHIVRSRGRQTKLVWQHARDTWQILIEQEEREAERRRLADAMEK